MPCPYTGPKKFCDDPNLMTKNLIAFIASSKTLVAAQKPNLVNGNHLLVWHKMFETGTKCIIINFWSDQKKIGPAQKLLEPVEGRGINLYKILFDCLNM